MDKSKRSAIIAGNWKMNKTQAQAKELINGLKELVDQPSCGVIICTPYTDLGLAVEMCKNTSIKVGAENCHWAESGAFTGEIAPSMLTEIGVEYVIVGHSERRQYFGETDETVNQRVKAALAAGLKPIICVGELLDERESGKTNDVIEKQTRKAFDGIEKQQLKNVIIAYEPVWAIGTGKTATADQAGEVCGFIRKIIEKIYSANEAEAMSILYGGSMKGSNASELLSQKDVDGGLIGGAALKAPDFYEIIKAAL